RALSPRRGDRRRVGPHVRGDRPPGRLPHPGRRGPAEPGGRHPALDRPGPAGPDPRLGLAGRAGARGYPAPVTSSPPRPSRVPAPVWLVTLVLATLSMIGPFTIDTIFPGFAQMGEAFDAGPAALQQVTSVYLLSFALMSVVHGPLSDALGRRPVMLLG